MSYERNYILKSRSTLHNNHLQVQSNGTTIYLAETKKLNSDDYVIELLDTKQSRLVATAKASVSGDRCFATLGEPENASSWLRMRRVPPGESMEFELRGVTFAWKCTKNVMGVRNFDLVRSDDGGKKLATFTKMRGLLVRRTMAELSFFDNLDVDVELIGLVAILANQERIRLRTPSSSGGGAGGFS